MKSIYRHIGFQTKDKSIAKDLKMVFKLGQAIHRIELVPLMENTTGIIKKSFTYVALVKNKGKDKTIDNLDDILSPSGIYFNQLVIGAKCTYESIKCETYEPQFNKDLSNLLRYHKLKSQMKQETDKEIIRQGLVYIPKFNHTYKGEFWGKPDHVALAKNRLEKHGPGNIDVKLDLIFKYR